MVAQDTLGGIRYARGELSAATEAYRNGLAIAEALTAEDPGIAEWQRDLIVSNVELAGLAELEGRIAEARTPIRRGAPDRPRAPRYGPARAGRWLDPRGPRATAGAPAALSPFPGRPRRARPVKKDGGAQRA
jgi:hypothetical protein